MVIGGHIFAAGIATYRGHDGWYKNIVMPLIHRTLDSELVHNLAIRAAHYGIVPRMKLTDHPELVCLFACFNDNNKKIIQYNLRSESLLVLTNYPPKDCKLSYCLVIIHLLMQSDIT